MAGRLKNWKSVKVVVKLTVMVAVDTGPPVELSVRWPVNDPMASNEGSAVTMTVVPVVPDNGLAESHAESEVSVNGSAAPEELTVSGALTGCPPARAVS